MVAIAEFILDLLKVVVTVNERKNIVGFFSIHIKSMMLRKKVRCLQNQTVECRSVQETASSRQL